MRGARALVAVLAFVAACSTSYGEAPAPADPLPDGGGGGENQDPNIEVTPATLDFGDVPCGTETPAKLLTILNKGPKPASYKVVVPDGSPVKVTGQAEGTLDGNGVATVQVVAKPGGAGETTSELIIIAGNGVQTVASKVRGSGATFELFPSTVDFGDVRMQSGGGPIDVEVRNTGTLPVSFAGFEVSADFVVSLDASMLKLEPGTKAVAKATLKSATAPSTLLQATLKPVLTQTLCGPAPVLTLTGRRVNSNVTLSSGDFAKQNCTPQAAARDIIVSNYSGSALTYTATLASGSKFTLVSGATGSLVGGTATNPTVATISVQPKPFGTNLGAILEDLDVDVSGIAPPEGGLRKVPLRVDVRGAIIAITPQQLTGFVSNGSNTDMKSFTVNNTGNELIYLSWDFVRLTGGPAWTFNPPSSVAAGQTRTGTVGFRPSDDGLHEATLTPRSTSFFGGAATVTCTPLIPITLKGMKQ